MAPNLLQHRPTCLLTYSRVKNIFIYILGIVLTLETLMRCTPCTSRASGERFWSYAILTPAALRAAADIAGSCDITRAERHAGQTIVSVGKLGLSAFLPCCLAQPFPFPGTASDIFISFFL